MEEETEPNTEVFIGAPGQPPDLTAGSRLLRARMNHSNAGFFAQVTFALNQIRYCERNGLIPVVYFGRDSVDGENAFYDPSAGDNVWEYYFEPVAGISSAELMARIEDPNDFLSPGQVSELSNKELADLHERNNSSIFNYPYGRNKRRGGSVAWYERQRARARETIGRYLRIKPEILGEVERYTSDHFAGRPIIGAHLRGTDKGTANAATRLMRIIGPREYFPHVDRFLSDHDGARVFVATDQTQYVEAFRKRYGERLIVREALRATGAVNVFQQSGDAYRKGLEVLIDALLLARCKHLLKCTSAVGEYAVYFNGQLTCLDLNHANNRLSPLQRWWAEFGRWRRRNILKKRLTKARE